MKSRFSKCFTILVIVLLNVSSALEAQLAIGEILVDTNSIAQNLDTPWEILWGPDDHIWITERYGKVSRIDPVSGQITSLITISDVYEESESGLLGMALHPNFSEQAFVYLVYNYFDGTIRERLARYTYTGKELIDPVVLLDNIPGARTHNGSRIMVGPDEKLYFSFGDVGVKSHSQDLSSLNGKILRMNLDGSIPDDNPFPDSYIWSYGHRNPQGLVFSPGGILYSSEHGPSNDDEVNLILKGNNYGWPIVEGFCNIASEVDFCADSNVAEPLIAWTPTLAVAGLDYYPYDNIAAWKDKLLMVTLRTGKLLSLTLSADGNEIIGQETWIDGEFGRLRDLCVAPDGRVFISTSNNDGRGKPKANDDKIFEIMPSGINLGSSVTRNFFDFTIFPNPSSDKVTINMGSSVDHAKYKIFHSSGKMILEGAFSGTSVTVNTSNIPQGYYYVQVQFDQQVKIKAMIVP